MPVLEANPVVVENVQLTPVVEYMTPAPAITHACAAPVVEYMTPAPAAARAATAAPTVFPTVTEQNKLPTAQTVQKTEEIPQVRNIDKVVSVPGVWQRQKPTIQTSLKTIVPQVQYLEPVVDVPVVTQQTAEKQVLQRIQKPANVPRVQYNDKVVDVSVPQSKFESNPKDSKAGVMWTTEAVIPGDGPSMFETTLQQYTVAVTYADEVAPEQSDDSMPCPVPPAMTQEVLVPVAVPKTLLSPHVQFIDNVDVPVMAQRQVHSIQRVQKTVEVLQIQFLDKFVDAPVGVQADPEIELEVTTPVAEDRTGVSLNITDPTPLLLTRHAARERVQTSPNLRAWGQSREKVKNGISHKSIWLKWDTKWKGTVRMMEV